MSRGYFFVIRSLKASRDSARYWLAPVSCAISARSVKHLVLALDELRRLGVAFVSYNENIDTGSPLGQAIFTIIAAMAALEWNIIVERVHAGMRRARQQGKRIGRPSSEVDAKRVLELRRMGRSMRQIAATLRTSRTKICKILHAVTKPPRKATPHVLAQQGLRSPSSAVTKPNGFVTVVSDQSQVPAAEWPRGASAGPCASNAPGHRILPWVKSPLPCVIWASTSLDCQRVDEHKYQVEQKAADIKLVKKNDKQIQLMLTCQADPELYDQLLTLITRVPTAWRKCQVIQGVRRAVIEVADGLARYEALPGADQITLHPED